MSGEEHRLVEEVRQAAQDSITRVLGEPVRLGENSFESPIRVRGVVLRCALTPPAHGISDVIVKAPHDWLGAPEEQVPWFRRFNPDIDVIRTVQDRFRQEVGSLKFIELGGIQTRAPKLIAADFQHSVVAMEDLGEHETLFEPLQRQDPDAAAQAMLSFTRGMARLHGSSVGKEELFSRCVDGGVTRCTPFSPFEKGMQQCSEFARTAGVTVPKSVDDATAAVLDYFAGSQDRMVFTPGDVGPGNQFVLDQGLSVFDFEYAAYRHVAIELANITMSFPMAWTTSELPADLVDELTDTYFAHAGDFGHLPDQERRRLREFGEVWWTFASIGADLGIALQEDYQWGLASCRSRHLHKLDALVRRADPSPSIQALSGFAADMHGLLGSLWPDTERFPGYPAFGPA